MTKDDLPITPRPADPFTAQDGARLFTLIDTGLKRISSLLEEQSNRLAIMQRNDIKILEILNIIEDGLTTSRMGRLELEIQETERERDIAEAALRAVEEKLNLKVTAKDQTAGTDEKIKVAAQAAYTDIEKRRKEEEAAFQTDLKRSILKAILISLSVGAVSGFLGFIWWLVQLYLSRGAP